MRRRPCPRPRWDATRPPPPRRRRRARDSSACVALSLLPDPDGWTLPPGGGANKARVGARQGGPGCPNGQPSMPARMPDDGWRRTRAATTIGRVIHDVDQLLEKLVKKEALNGSSVDLVFEAPTKDWVARRSGPAVNLYLYDIREDLQRRVPTWEDARAPNGTVSGRQQPPRRFRLAYLVTAWTQRPEDEHRLLSSLLVCMLRNPMLKPGELGGSLDEADLPLYIEVGQPESQERSLADIWTALGGELKPSLDVVVTAPIVIGQSAPYGPPVTSGPTIGLASTNGAVEEANGSVKRKSRTAVADPEPEPVAEETVPRGAAKDQGGLRLRVRGVPSKRP